MFKKNIKDSSDIQMQASLYSSQYAMKVMPDRAGGFCPLIAWLRMNSFGKLKLLYWFTVD